MFTNARARGDSSRADKRIRVSATQLAIAATALLIAAPFAHAATTGETKPATQPAGGAAPIANDAAAKPRLSARLSDARSVSGDGIRVRGIVRGIGSARAKVYVKVRRNGKRGWTRVAAAKVRGGKKFTLRWRGGRVGTYQVRVSTVRGQRNDVARVGSAHVFRRSYASYYGPGLYGGGLACGGTLSPSTVGVAHKTLPCGTKVAFYVGSRVVTARVIDRGPFVAGREWDLTAALKRRLGFGSTGAVYTTR